MISRIANSSLSAGRATLVALFVLSPFASACGDSTGDGASSQGGGHETGGAPETGGGGAGGSGGIDGQGGDVSQGGGGNGNEFECPEGVADCDDDLVNGCEVDTTSDNANCGGCGLPCDGRCFGSECTPFEVIATDQYWMLTPSIAFTADSIFWASSSDENDQSSDMFGFWKSAKSPLGTPTALVSNLPKGYLVATGSQKLYAVSWDYEMQSVAFDGSGYGVEVPYAQSVAFASPDLWYTQNYNGHVYLNWKSVVSASTGTAFQLPYTPAVEQYGIANSFVIGDDGYAYFALGHATAGFNGPTYQIRSADKTGAISNVVVPSSSGRVGRMRRHQSDMFWIETSAGAASTSVILALQPATSSYATKLQGTENVTDFALDAPKIYYAFYDPDTYQRGLRSFDIATYAVKDLIVGISPSSLEIDDSNLYFYESSSARIIRIPLDALQ